MQFQNDDFRQLYEQHVDVVRAYCLRRLPAADAHDVVADVFVVAWRRFDQCPSFERALPWLYSIARNTIAHSRRSHARRGRLRRKAEHVRVVSDDGPETRAIHDEDVRLVLTHLERLAESDQEVLRLSFWEELTAAEIGDVIGVSTSAAEKRLTRARKRLSESIERAATATSLRGGGA